MTSAFSWQNSISLCPASFRIPRVHCILFTHSSVDGHLSCFHFLAFINNAGMNIHVQVLYKHIFSFLLGIYPRVGLLGHMVTLCYFKELPDYF